MTAPAARPAESFDPRLFWGAALVLIAARVIAQIISPLELYPDEAQYWGWSREFAFGYYSKPPMVAWVIGLTTSVFGNSEWALRLAAPFLHAGTALFLYLTGRELFGERTGLWAGLAWLTLPGIALSSFVISTDAPLLLMIAGMVFAFVKYVRTQSWPWAAALGAAIGLGFLAKYAMVFPCIGAAAVFLIDRDARRAFLSVKSVLIAAVAAVVIAPNILWNAANGFATVSHTADNANLDAELFNPGHLIEFWVDQLAVAGPVLFPLLIVALVRAFRTKDAHKSALVWLALFTLPALIVISGQAFLSRANANWAASAYPAGVLLLTAWGLAHARKWFFAGLALNAALALFLIVLTMFPAVADALGQSNAFKRMRGWEAMTEQVIEAAKDGGYGLIAPDDRFVFQTMDYYARNRNDRPVMKMWLRHDAPHNHAEMIAPLPQETEGPILIVSKFEDHIEWLERDFERLEPAGEIVIPIGGERTRTLRLYEAEGYAPVPRD